MILCHLSVVCLSAVTNFNIGNISDTIYSRVMTVCQKVACGETFKVICPWVTLTFGKGHSVYWKFGKYPFLAHV